MKCFGLGLLTFLFLIGSLASSSASLITIGTANYDHDIDGVYNSISDKNDLKLVWDNTNNLVWLDFVSSRGRDNLFNHQTWSAGLESKLALDLNPKYDVNWVEAESWSLPKITDLMKVLGGATSAFDDLPSMYSNAFFWSNTIHPYNNSSPPRYWAVKSSDTSTMHAKLSTLSYYGLASRQADVSLNPVPEPSTVIMLSAGLAAIAGIRRRKE